MTGQILSCDWGTSAFRLRLVNVEKAVVLKEFTGGRGIASVYDDWIASGQPESGRPGFYKQVLQSLLDAHFTEDIKDVPVIISGMASSTIGMKEIAYSELPLDLGSMNVNVDNIKADDNLHHDIFLVSGVRTAKDVMRGEETMLMGVDMDKEEEALAIFPGTHSKHVTVKGNAAVDCKTYMTGEMFDLLVSKSILAKSVVRNSNNSTAIFIKGIEEGAGNNFLNSIFHVRTNQLFTKYNEEENYHFLSGLVIGHELKEVGSADKNICLICSNNLLENYATALSVVAPGNTVRYYDAGAALVRAHCRLFNTLNRIPG